MLERPEDEDVFRPLGHRIKNMADTVANTTKHYGSKTVDKGKDFGQKAKDIASNVLDAMDESPTAAWIAGIVGAALISPLLGIYVAGAWVGTNTTHLRQNLAAIDLHLRKELDK